MDLECPVGTLVLAAGPGVVASVEQNVLEGGILVPLLFRWNAIVLQLDSGATVEYVHVRPHSARVCAGERVTRGQVLCASGDVSQWCTPSLTVVYPLADQVLCESGDSGFTVVHPLLTVV